MSYIGAIDQGTTSTRFMIFDQAGKVISAAQKEHTQILPQAGWVEHDPLEILRATEAVIKEALQAANLKGSDLAGIGITNQRETTVAWSALSGVPLHNAIVWQDTRSQGLLDQIDPVVATQITYKTGLPLASYFSASKMSWMLEHSPIVKSAADQQELLFGTIDSWLVWNLSEENIHVTDVSNASRTLLMNLETLQWDEDLLAVFGIERRSLAEIKSSSEIYGYTSATGVFGARIPIAGIVGDQHAALLGQLCFEKGESKTTYGTGNFALINTGTDIVRSKKGLLTTLAFQLGDEPAKYALEGSVAVTGSAVQWLRDQMGIIESSAEIETLAASVSDNAGVYFVPAFSGLFAPYWRGDARGVIVGLTRAATKAHLARATLEAICYQTLDVVRAMEEETGVAIKVLRVDGGVTQNQLCMQMQADILQTDVSRPVVAETTALGAAYAAGLAVGLWKSKEELLSQWEESHHWRPQLSAEKAAAGLQGWKKAIERTLNWV
jgi:glycerol kinase